MVTLRFHGRLHHIGIGRAHARTHVLLLVHDRHIRVINATTGDLIRELTLDPSRDYQPRRRPQPQNAQNPEPMRVQGYADVLRHHIGAPRGNRTPNPLAGSRLINGV